MGSFEVIAATKGSPIDPRHLTRLKNERPVGVEQGFSAYHNMKSDLDKIAKPRRG